MKIRQLLSTASVIALLFILFPACEEVGPAGLNLPDPNDTSQVVDSALIPPPDSVWTDLNLPASQDKVVLMEEYTGVKCINCPDGHEKIEQIKTTNGSRFLVISLHPNNPLSFRYSFSAQDFIRGEATEFAQVFPFPSLPSALVDRHEFEPGEKVFGRAFWSTYVDQRLQETTPVNIDMSTSLLNDSTYLLAVRLHYTGTVSEKNNLTVAVIEEDIVSAQLGHGNPEIDTFYTHKHTFRDFLSGVSGDRLDYTLNSGTVIERYFPIRTRDLWVLNNVYLVAYVHEFENSNLVYHAAQIPLLP